MDGSRVCKFCVVGFLCLLIGMHPSNHQSLSLVYSLDSQEGDIHQPEFDEYRVSTNLTWNDLHEQGAPMYTLSLCKS